MLYRRQGQPEEDEIVLCTVTQIYPNSIFVQLQEYNKQGMVHISEISPGRIRNLRDFVSVGRQIICKVLKIDQERGHIDLSLRRVNSTQRKEKLDEIKQELKAESIVKSVAKRIKKPVDEVYQSLKNKIFQEYSHLYLCFRDVSVDSADLLKIGVEKTIAEPLTEIIKDKFKPPKIVIEGEIKIRSYQPDGVEIIKKNLTDIEKISPTISLHYLGAGRFKVIIEDIDYKSAEKDLKKILDILEKLSKDKLSSAEFIREKKD